MSTSQGFFGKMLFGAKAVALTVKARMRTIRISETKMHSHAANKDQGEMILMLSDGQKAPDFALKDRNGNVFTLQQFAGKTVVLFFYPKDKDSKSAIEIAAFSALLPEFEACNAVVLGVNRDSMESHGAFLDKFKLPITLLSDPEGLVVDAYQAYKRAPTGKKPSKGTDMVTYVINPDGTIRDSWAVIHRPMVHPAQVRDLLLEDAE